MMGKCIETAYSPATNSEIPSGEIRKLRILRLYRRTPAGTYGFHLRGGRENGTGFFISHVDSGTEAFAQGLRIGDQVLRVNDCDVSGALHKEVASLVRSGSSVTLHVRSAGSLSNNTKLHDSSSRAVTHSTENSAVIPTEWWRRNSSEFSPKQIEIGNRRNSQPTTNHNPKSVQIVIEGTDKTVIGCSICKGPAEKPGIFVQRVTKEGIAHKCGLRAGDQIIACNGVQFGLDQDFQKAIQVMKGSSTMRLEVLQGVGFELAAGESSGYNSSASSETSDDFCSLFEMEGNAGYPKSIHFDSVRLNHPSNQLQIDNNRGWEEIDAEWADAELTLKKLTVNHNQTRDPRKTQNEILAREGCIDEEGQRHDIDNSQIYATCSSCCQLVSLGSVVSKMPLTKHRSMLDLCHNDSDFSHQPSRKHCKNKIGTVLRESEQSALRRLERLSSAPVQVSSKSTISCKTNSISSTSSDDSSCYVSHKEHASKCSSKRPVNNIRRNDHPMLIRCSNVNADSVEQSSGEDSDSLFSFPSSTVSISDGTNGRFTSRIVIRSSPPVPPPRGKATKLTNILPDYRCGHSNLVGNRNFTLKKNSRLHYSTDNLVSDCMTNFDQWKDATRDDVSITNNSYSPVVPPPAPPLPSQPLAGGIIPPPPPPMPNTILTQSHSPLNSSGHIHFKELAGAASKLKTLENKDTNHFKVPSVDPKKAQHDKLMEEFKKAHAQMVSRRKFTEAEETT